jgi:hypothetical protein
MNEPAEPISSDDLDVGVDEVGQRSLRAGLVQDVVGTVVFVLGEYIAQMRGVDDQYSVEISRTYAAYPALMIAFMRGA